MKYWYFIKIPNFANIKQKEIAEFYHKSISYPDKLDSINFLEQDKNWNNKAGIVEIDKSSKKIKENLNKILDKIVNGEEVKIDFSFLS